MKEITITETIKMPTAEELEAVAKNYTPFKPRQATIITCFVCGEKFESEESKAVYECMNEADESRKNSIASDVAVAYCKENKIEWGTIRVISVAKFGEHFVIEALVETRA